MVISDLVISDLHTSLQDHDGDGKITVKEHDADMHAWVLKVAQQAIKEGDKNGDGMLSKEEFMAIHMEL
jgi:hypothetical protein